jgi:hypothetical protein
MLVGCHAGIQIFHSVVYGFIAHLIQISNRKASFFNRSQSRTWSRSFSSLKACQPRSITGQSHPGSVSDVIGITCHPEPLFFGGEGFSKTQSQGFFRLAKNTSLQKDILRVFSSGSNVGAIALRCIIFIRSVYR